MESMYRGQERFTREQLVFVVEAALAGAFDKVDGAMPQTEGDKETWNQDFNEAERVQFQYGAIQQVGIFVPILWAQLNGDGMGTNDFYGWAEVEAAYEKFLVDKWENPSIFHPDFRPLAEKIVDENFFKNYFRKKLKTS
jgi:hypothetical protein